MSEFTPIQGISQNGFQQARGSQHLKRLQSAFAQASQGKAVTEKGQDPLRQAAEGFESVFLSQMLGPMFAGLKTDGPLGGGHAEQVYRSMLVDEFGSAIAKSGGIGIADSVYKQLLEIQEGAQK